MHSPIRLAIAGVGNCASSLVQGITYYRDAVPDDVVPAQLDVHEPGHDVARVGVPVIRDPLDQGTGAVADAGDREADGGVHLMSPWMSVLRSGRRLRAGRR